MSDELSFPATTAVIDVLGCPVGIAREAERIMWAWEPELDRLDPEDFMELCWVAFAEVRSAAIGSGREDPILDLVVSACWS